MKIERVDDHTVKCFLSNEELEEYEITYKDFVIRSDKAREVVEDIMEQAEEEVGYHPPGHAFDLQVVVLPEKGMILTFSEKETEGKKVEESLVECLKEMKQLLQDKKKELFTQQDNTADEETRQQDEDDKEPKFSVFSFHHLKDVCQYAAMLPEDLSMVSSLFRMDDTYFLLMERDKASREKYSRACIHALEFGALYTADEKRLGYLLEHGECLIKGNALDLLVLG